MSVFRDTADQIRARLETDGTWVLPPLHQLCREYGVSYQTARRALRVLADEGRIDVGRGRQATVRGRGPRSRVCTGKSSAYDLRSMIRGHIVEGRLRAGAVLPKIGYYTLSFHLSPTTVCEAMRMLRDEHLIHKRGRSWVVGPSSSSSVRTVSRVPLGLSMPTVLVLVPSDDRWQVLFQRHLEAFSREFGSELANCGVHQVAVQATTTRPHTGEWATGRGEIARLIISLGEQYRGTLIASNYDRIPDMERWITWLCGYGRPVIWLDHENAKPSLDRRAVGRKNYWRCFADSPAAAEMAVSCLVDRGHVRIGLPLISVGRRARTIVEHRAKEVLEAVERLRAPCTLHPVTQTEDFWKKEAKREFTRDYGEYMLSAVDKAYAEAGLSRGNRSAAKLDRMASGKLKALLPSMSELTDRHHVTAIISPNQRFAVSHYYWLKYSGVAVPKRLSLIAFDDRPVLSRHPITTVGWRFAQIGYKAAHVFIDDIPVRTDRRGNLTAPPLLIDRGSVGPAPGGRRAPGRGRLFANKEQEVIEC
ncbi:MAG: GntR family transcriptional regulator [Chitinivibrionales bacterium]|nr:GntR family transcriptional regulator [Chitinivibrionales bacterium]MBD3394072.1 GntR family transcriptional regulator [Chitinivibrionales bacterium]